MMLLVFKYYLAVFLSHSSGSKTFSSQRFHSWRWWTVHGVFYDSSSHHLSSQTPKHHHTASLLCVFQQVEEDRYKEMLDRSDSENIANTYFKSKRASQLLGRDATKGYSKTSTRPHWPVTQQSQHIRDHKSLKECTFDHTNSWITL